MNGVDESLKDTGKLLAGEQTAQLIIKNQYRALQKEEIRKYDFNEVGFRKYSQNSEDGILLFIFAAIGTTNKKIVELCASDGIECNAANLIINHGWQALLFDGNTEAIEKGKKFYRSHPDTFTLPPIFVNAWITKNNVNELIANQDYTGEIDLLSIDMDGVDYWIWDSITVIKPRVVVVEVQCIFGAGDSVTVPYADNFKTEFIDGFGVYSGASLNAFIKLASHKGYRLVGVEKYGFNAFFIREDIAADIFPEYDISGYEDIPFVKWAKAKFLEQIKDKKWEQV
ncbi:hypothetical protein SAMN04488024_107213 [Pedobacter soli]|uniref:Methyltransferase FkbM domain-containing protein n=2 Tax=Pedobacter soli TaxID=390242 RepID=A0A1G6X3I1_9SPHI|nr:hypothetical protein SAMN04488024_107213 [Pedobacter soli]